MRRTGAMVSLLWLVVTVASCSPSGPPVGAATASQAQIQHVTAFLKPGLSLDHAYVVRSEAHQNASFFAAQIVGTRSEPAVVVWLISGPSDSPGTTLSIDAYAKEYSVAPDGAQTKAEVSMTDPPASDRYHAAS